MYFWIIVLLVVALNACLDQCIVNCGFDYNVWIIAVLVVALDACLDHCIVIVALNACLDQSYNTEVIGVQD